MPTRRAKPAVASLKQLGNPVAMPASPAEALLERIPNPHPDKRYLARFAVPEFTSLCPITGQPDWGMVRLGEGIVGVYSTSDKTPLAQSRPIKPSEKPCACQSSVAKA